MALIWSKMSTGMPIDVRSAQRGQGFISHYSLDIDIRKYVPPDLHQHADRFSCPGKATWGKCLFTLRKTEAGLRRNEPHIHLAERLPNPDGWRGSELSVTILGNWSQYRPRICRRAYFPCIQSLIGRCLVKCHSDEADLTP